MEHKLSENDYAILKEIIKLETENCEIYQNLASLEFENLKDSQEYDAYLDTLKFNLNTLNNLYMNFKDDVDKLLKMQEVLAGLQDPDFASFITLISFNPMALTRLRALSIFEDIELAIRDEEAIADSIIDENIDLSVFEEMDEETDAEELEEELEEISMEEHSVFERLTDIMVENDIVTTILGILEKYILKEENMNIKEKLIRFKYNLIYSFPKIEKCLIPKRFTCDDVIYWNSSVIGDYAFEDYDDYANVMYSYGEDMLHEAYDTFCDCYFDKQEGIDEEYLAKHVQIVLRSALLFVSEAAYNEFLLSVFSEMNTMGFKNKQLQSELFDSFTYLNEDKSRVRMISLKLHN